MNMEEKLVLAISMHPELSEDMGDDWEKGEDMGDDWEEREQIDIQNMTKHLQVLLIPS